MNITFGILVLIPFLFCGISWFLFRKTIVWQEALIMFGLTVFVVSCIFFAGKYSSMSDTKYLTGEITNKTRVNDSHMESYSCNCRTRCSGGKYRTCSTTCSTCWRRRYTVDWDVSSTLGNCEIDRETSLSSSVWETPDPTRYTSIKVGDALHKSYAYTNYIKGAPDSILNINPMIDKYEKIIPEYSDIFDIYRFNHVVPIGLNFNGTLSSLNLIVENALKFVSPKNHLNIRVIVTNIKDKQLRYAVENKWRTGKVNDTIIFLGLDDENNVIWSDVSSWLNNENNNEYVVGLRNTLNEELKSLNVTQFSDILNRYISNYKETNMEKFEYLKESVEPPEWVVILCFLLEIFGLTGLAVYFHKNEIF